MFDQKEFGAKLRNHRKRLGLTQEEVAERIGVSPQAISKWEAGDCLPDCINLKAISDAYHLSADVLLEIESNGDVNAVADKIEQLATEFLWASANSDRYEKNLRKEMGEDLWKMWKGIYFAEVGNRKLQQESKQRGTLRITGSFGAKVWDDDGIACVVQSPLVKSMLPTSPAAAEVVQALSTPEGQKLISALSCECPTAKQTILEQTEIPLPRLNELLLLFTENNVVEHYADHTGKNGYMIGGHCGIAAYMVMGAMYLLDKKRNYEVSQYYSWD
ncbi:MAG: helix-turn-helix transcriptional regulator [Ruminococcaceae bacterium]|nr:helix-turn-helix transcriptional regulator [Oscillospiraceae bacterium]